MRTTKGDKSILKKEQEIYQSGIVSLRLSLHFTYIELQLTTFMDL